MSDETANNRRDFLWHHGILLISHYILVSCLLGAGHCQWGGLTDRNIYNVRRLVYFLLAFQRSIFKYLPFHRAARTIPKCRFTSVKWMKTCMNGNGRLIFYINQRNGNNLNLGHLSDPGLSTIYYRNCIWVLLQSTEIAPLVLAWFLHDCNKTINVMLYDIEIIGWYILADMPIIL